MSEETIDSIVCRCGGCKRVVYAAVNKPHVLDADQILDIGKIIKDGGTVEHMSVENVRKSDFGCKCDEGDNLWPS